MRYGKGESHGLGLHPFTGVLLLGASGAEGGEGSVCMTLRKKKKTKTKKQCINKNKQKAHEKILK